jgi:iron complex transport system ATP-binding protein
MIRATDLTFRVAGRALVDRVSLTFAPGNLHLIIGVNGAGKSTLLRLLSRLLRPTEGSVEYSGQRIEKWSDRELARRRSLLSQSIELGFSMRVRDLVMMGRYPHFGTHPGPTDEHICDEVLDYFDAQDLTTRHYGTLSGGEKQRVQFARVLAQIWRPLKDSNRYLFLDEPLTFLDIRHQLEFMARMRDFAHQPDVVAVGVLHDLNLAAQFADRLVLLHDGKVKADGSPEDVLTLEQLRDAFGISPIVTSHPQTGRPHLMME